VFTADFAHATVSVIDGASCNAFSQRGCARRGRQLPVGNIPSTLPSTASTTVKAG